MKKSITTHAWLESSSKLKVESLEPGDFPEKIVELLSVHFAHGGELFKLSPTFYKLDTDAELEQRAKELFVWLGVKPGHIEVKYTPLKQPGTYTEDPGMKRLLINESLTSHPLQTAAVLVHLVMHAVIGGKKRFEVQDFNENEQFINKAIIETGLGLITLNGLSGMTKRHAKLKLYTVLPETKSFTKDLLAYMSATDIAFKDAVPYIVPWAASLLPGKLGLLVKNAPEQAHMTSLRYKSNRRVVRFSLSFVCLSVLVIFAAFSS